MCVAWTPALVNPLEIPPWPDAPILPVLWLLLPASYPGGGVPEPASLVPSSGVLQVVAMNVGKRKWVLSSCAGGQGGDELDQLC